MNYFNTVYNSLLKPTSKINSLDIVLESNGEYSTPPSNNYTPINDKLQTSFLKPISNISSGNPIKQSTTSTTSTSSTSTTSTSSTSTSSISSTSNYNPPSTNLSTSNNYKEESPFSKFKIWGQKS